MEDVIKSDGAVHLIDIHVAGRKLGNVAPIPRNVWERLRTAFLFLEMFENAWE